MASAADLLLGDPVVIVALLNSLPASNDPSTWDQVNWPGYVPSLAIAALVTDQRPSLIAFQVDAVINIPSGATCPPFYGLWNNGRGLAFGPFLDAEGNVAIGSSGRLLVRIPIIFQYFIP